jgi:hypothetical protein
MNNEQLKSNLLSSKHWLRLLFMILFALLLQVVSFIMGVLVILQFLFSLITGQDNINLRKFGSSLTSYIYQTLKFLTYNSEEKPFPFADWPAPEITEAVAEDDVVIVESTSETVVVVEATVIDETDKPDADPKA